MGTTFIQAIASYGPRVELQRTIRTRQLAGYIQGRTSLNRGGVENVLSELNEAIIFFARQGAPVKLEGILGIGFRLDSDIDSMLNVANLFTGSIKNHENVGKSTDEHPDDLIA